MDEAVYYKVRLFREYTRSLLSVEIYEGLNEEQWMRYVDIKFPEWGIVAWLKFRREPQS
jgi:hypothetical protein